MLSRVIFVIIYYLCILHTECTISIHLHAGGFKQVIFLYILSPLLFSSQPTNLSEDFFLRAIEHVPSALYFLLLLSQFLFLSFVKTLLSKIFLTIATFVLRCSCSILLNCLFILQHLVSMLVFFSML